MKVNRISVALATYNGEKFLREQLDSIVHQTHPVQEIVVSDDASMDHTLQIIQDYCGAEKQIDWIVLQNENRKGVTENFRRAVSAVSGDIIFLCDQDDIWEANRVEEIVNIFEKHDHVQAVAHDFRMIDAEGKTISSTPPPEKICGYRKEY